ncbi:MAG: hypothetical protein HDR35_06370 [Treponema sp.]|nr:hypothetical protein [Treponema sp.]
MGEGKPSTSEAGFSLSQTLTLSQHGLGLHPKTPLALLTEFSPKTRSLYSRRFYLSKALLRLSWRVFSVQKNFRCFPCAISAFKNTFVLSLVQFWLSKVLLLLPRCGFCVQKCFCRFPSVFSDFKSSFVAFSAQFRASKELFSFGSNKNQYIKEFLWQK